MATSAEYLRAFNQLRIEIEELIAKPYGKIIQGEAHGSKSEKYKFLLREAEILMNWSSTIMRQIELNGVAGLTSTIRRELNLRVTYYDDVSNQPVKSVYSRILKQKLESLLAVVNN